MSQTYRARAINIQDIITSSWIYLEAATDLKKRLYFLSIYSFSNTVHLRYFIIPIRLWRTLVTNC